MLAITVSIFWNHTSYSLIPVFCSPGREWILRTCWPCWPPWNPSRFFLMISTQHLVTVLKLLPERFLPTWTLAQWFNVWLCILGWAWRVWPRWPLWIRWTPCEYRILNLTLKTLQPKSFYVFINKCIHKYWLRLPLKKELNMSWIPYRVLMAKLEQEERKDPVV